MGNVIGTGPDHRWSGSDRRIHPPGVPQPETVATPPAPYVEYQKADKINIDANYIKKETLRIEPDEENPGHFLVSFTFDAPVSGRADLVQRVHKATIDTQRFDSCYFYLYHMSPSGQSVDLIFFAKEGKGCIFTRLKENVPRPVTVDFQQGLGQKFRQPAGTGINFSLLKEYELLKVGDKDFYPVVVKVDAFYGDHDGLEETLASGHINSQITKAVFVKEKGEFQVKVVKQILWLNGMRCEQQEIYGAGNPMKSEPEKECVICLSEPRDTVVFPCRHKCMCSGCAEVLRFQTNRCPICRQPVERLMEF